MKDDRGELDLIKQIEELKKEIEELREDNRRLASQISDLTNNRRYHEGV